MANGRGVVPLQETVGDEGKQTGEDSNCAPDPLVAREEGDANHDDGAEEDHDAPLIKPELVVLLPKTARLEAATRPKYRE